MKQWVIRGCVFSLFTMIYTNCPYQDYAINLITAYLWIMGVIGLVLLFRDDTDLLGVDMLNAQLHLTTRTTTVILVTIAAIGLGWFFTAFIYAVGSFSILWIIDNWESDADELGENDLETGQ